MRGVQRALVATTSVLIALGCSSSPEGVAPPSGQGAAADTRTSVLQARIPLSGGPLGIAVSSPGLAYVTRDQAASVARLDLTHDSVTATIPVGQVPSFIAFDPTGTTAFVANQFSDNIGIIDVATNTQTAVIPVQGDPLPVAVSPDGITLFTTTNVNKLWKIDIATRTVEASLDLPATSHHLLVHPNDTLLYVATRDAGSVLEVNWRTMTVARTFTLGGRTQGMALSPDKKELYVANELSNVLHVIDLVAGAPVASIPLASGGEGLALSTDNARLYVGLVFAGEVQVIDRVGRTVIQTLVTGGVPREIAADPAHQTIAVANESGWIDVIALGTGSGGGGSTGSILDRIQLPGGPVGVTTSRQNAYVTLDQAASVARLDLTQDNVTATFPVGQVPSFIAFDPAGTTAYVANQFSDNVGVIDAASNTQTSAIPVRGDPLPVAVAPDGSTLFTTTNAFSSNGSPTGEGGTLFKINLATRTVTDSLALPATSHHLLAHPNDTLLYVATRDAGSVLEVNWRTMTVLRTFTLGGRPQGMALSLDKTELYVANELSNVLHVIDLRSGATVASVLLASGGEGLALNAAGTKLCVGLVFAGEVQIIDRVARTVVGTIATGGVPREVGAESNGRMVVANESGWVDIVSP